MATRPRKSVPAALLGAASRQHDLLHVAQLVEGGLSHQQIGALVAADAIHRLHRGVYKVGTPTPSRDGRLLAAVYAAGPGSAVSHRDAGELHELPVRGGRAISVTTRRGRRDRPGIDLHRTRRLAREDVTEIRGIPVTTIARTVIDLADVVRPGEMPRLLHEAEVLGLEAEELERARTRANGRRTRALTAALGEHRPRTKREIEDRMEAIAERAGLGDPRRNVIYEVAGQPLELDRYYPHLRLCLEADGFGVHRTRKKFNSDRRRDRLLKVVAGITVLRYTWEDVTLRTAECERELAQFLGKPAPT